MGKRNQLPLPTHSGLAFNRLRDYLAYTFIIITIFWVLIIGGIKMIIDHNCSDPYRRKLNIFGYWINIKAGSTKPECTQ